MLELLHRSSLCVRLNARCFSLARTAFALIVAALAAARPLAAERTNVTVTIEPTEAGIVARFALDRPVTSFRLSYEAPEIYDRTWKVQTPNVARNGMLVMRTDNAPFDAFTVEIRPLNEPTGATYPCLFRVGADGFGLYAGYFAGVEEEFDTTIEVIPPKDHVVAGFPLGGNVWRVDAAFQRNTAHRYFYLGPRTYLSETSNARFVISPVTPPAAAERIRQNADRATQFYARKLSRPLPTKPLIIVGENFDYEQPGVQGDTTMGPTVALRLFSKRWQSFEPASDRLDHLIAHEAAHFWTSDTYHAAKGSPAWMWEGGAEFLALETRVAVMKRLTLLGRHGHIEDALNRCAPFLFDHSLAVARSGTTYPCGEVVYWIADAAEKKRSHGRSDIFAIWQRIFDRADSSGGVYTLADFLTFAATSADAAKALSLFLAADDAERWQTLPDVLKPLGIEIATDAGPHDANTLRHIAMWHILDMTCAHTGRRGMRRETDHLKLDTGDHCGPLSGDPEVDALNGHNLFTDMSAAYASAQAVCAAGDDIMLTRSSTSEARTVPCTKPLSDPPPKFRIVSTP